MQTKMTHMKRERKKVDKIPMYIIVVVVVLFSTKETCKCLEDIETLLNNFAAGSFYLSSQAL